MQSLGPRGGDARSDGRSKRKGSARGRGGARARDEEEAVGRRSCGVVVALRDADGFGFVQPDASGGLPQTDIFFHYASSLAEGCSVEDLVVGTAVEFHVATGRDGKKRATKMRLAASHDPMASLRPISSMRPMSSFGPVAVSLLSAPLSELGGLGGRSSTGAAAAGAPSSGNRDGSASVGGEGGGGGGQTSATSIRVIQQQQEDMRAANTRKGMRAANTRKVSADGRVDVKGLLVLLRAPSQQEIERIFDDTFTHRMEARLPRKREAEISTKLR